MGFIPRRRIKENLREVEVFLEDNDNRIFVVQDVPDTFMQGRSAFKLFGSDFLKPDVPLKIEILDKAGTPVWTQPVIYGQQAPSLAYRYITVEVYPPPVNIPGEAELIILGELNEELIDVEPRFQGTYNVRYSKIINIDTEATINEQPILFYKKPQVTATEFVNAQKLTNAPTTRFISGSRLGGSVNKDIRGNTFVSSSEVDTQTRVNDKSESPSGDLAAQSNLWKYKTGLYKENKVLKRRGLKQEKSSPEKPQMTIRSSEDKFITKMVGSDITIKNITIPTASAVELSGLNPREVPIDDIYNAFTFPDFEGKVEDIKSDKELVLNKPYAVEFLDPTSTDTKPKKIFTDIGDDNNGVFVDFTASYTDWEVPITSSYRFDSFVDFTIEDMRTFSGDVYRVKISGGSDSIQGDFPVLLDTVVDAPELLVDTVSPSGVLRSGYFIDQDHIDKYWNTFGGNNNANQLTANYTMSLADGIYLSGSYEPYNQVGRVDLDNTYSFTVRKDVVYTLTFNAKGRKATKTAIDDKSYESAKIFFHLSGSNLKDFNESDIQYSSSFGNTITNEFGQPVGLEIEPDDPITAFKDFGIISHTFTPNFKLDRVKNTDTVVQMRIHSGEWIISDLSLKPATSTGFSPDEFKIRVPIPPNTLRPDNFDFLIEYLDINGNTAETLTFLDNVPISGSAFILEGDDNLLTGSLYMGNVSGEGIEAAGANSAFIRSVGYKGFLSASNATGINGGFMMFSGSVLPDESDNYTGVGLELVANSASYFKFRTNPSELDIRTDAFFVGNTDSSFISSSQGNIEISSSKFHVKPDGDVVMNNITASNANLSGKITATTGEIGGWDISDGELISGTGPNSVTMSSAIGLIAMGTGSSFNKSSMAGGLRMGFDDDGEFKFALGSAGSYIHFDADGVSIKSDSFDVTASVADINVDQFGLKSTNLEISSSGQYIAAGSTVPSGVDGTNKGFYVSAADNQLLIGDAAGGHFIFDGADVSISSSAFFLGNADNFISGSNTNFELFSSGTTTLSGSAVLIETPKFYLGEESQYISGSEGNIEISSSNFHLTAGGDVTMSGEMRASGGTIGGFVISSTEVSASGLLLKSGGQITASAIQLTGEVNIIGGSAKGQLDTLGAETASMKAKTASFESSVTSIGAKTASFAGDFVTVKAKTSSSIDVFIKLGAETASIKAVSASFQSSIGKLGVATSSIAGDITGSKEKAVATASLYSLGSISSASLFAISAVVSSSKLSAGAISSGSKLSEGAIASSSFIAAGSVSSASLFASASMQSASLFAVDALTSGSQATASFRFSLDVLGTESASMKARTASFESSVTSLGAKTASFQSSVTTLGQKTASLASGITAAGAGAQASSSAVQLSAEAGLATVSSSVSGSFFLLSGSAASATSASKLELKATFALVSSSVSGSFTSTSASIATRQQTDKLATLAKEATFSSSFILVGEMTSSLTQATASLATGITAAGVGAQASSSAVQLLKEASDAVFSSSFILMGEQTSSLLTATSSLATGITNVGASSITSASLFVIATELSASVGLAQVSSSVSGAFTDTSSSIASRQQTDKLATLAKEATFSSSFTLVGAMTASLTEATASAESSLASIGVSTASIAATTASIEVDSGSLAAAIQLTSASLNVLNSDSNIIAEFGANTFVGLQSSEHVQISPSGLDLKDGSTVLGRFASTTTIGDTSTEHVSISGSGLELLDGSTQRFAVNSSGVAIGDNFGVDASGNVTMAGNVTAAAGDIAGFTLADNNIESSTDSTTTAHGITTASLHSGEVPVFSIEGVNSGSNHLEFRSKFSVAVNKVGIISSSLGVHSEIDNSETFTSTGKFAGMQSLTKGTGQASFVLGTNNWSGSLENSWISLLVDTGSKADGNTTPTSSIYGTTGLYMGVNAGTFIKGRNFDGATTLDSVDNKTGNPQLAITAFDGSVSGSHFSTGSFGRVRATTIGGNSSLAIESTLNVYSDGDIAVPLATFTHGEAVLDTDDTILKLHFDDDRGIASDNYFIDFHDQDGQVGSINSEVVYSTFTGAHVSQRPSGSSYITWRTGMVVKSTGNIVATGSTISLAWPEVDLTTSQKDKAVMGVFTATGSAGHEIAHLDRTLPSINYNAVGEGKVLVTDTNGNIETGDYICSSVRTGHGEKQDEVYLANFTIAKATEAYNFTSASNDSDLGYKSVLIACTYHCG